MPAANELEWGLRHAVPETSRAAWGARAIVQDRGFDLLPDRQGIAAEDDDAKQMLIAALNGPNRGDGALAKAQETTRQLIDAGKLRNWTQVRSHEWDEIFASGKRDEPGEHVLYEDDVIKIVGNTNGSYGYLYIAGWLKP